MKARYVINCKQHGVESKDWAGKQVVVSRPAGKKARNERGCPHCRAAALAEKKEGGVA